jgi:hypothetical protein
MKSSYIVSCVPTSSISIGNDRIKESNSRFRKEKWAAYHQISVALESSQFPSWVGCITSTEEWPKRNNITR